MASYQSLVHQIDPRVQALSCSKELLERPTFNIIIFAAQFQKANEHLGQIVPRMVVDFFWINEIWRQYPADSPNKHRLIGQVFSPQYEVYWQKRLNADAFSLKRARQSSAEFWSFPRNLTKEEKKDKGVVLLGNHEWEYILPEIHLMPLCDIFFLELAKKVRVANPGKPLGLELMRRLWRLMIREVYDFVDEAEKLAKLEEARVVTVDDFEETVKIAPSILSKKRELSPEGESEMKPSKIQKQQSEVGETVKFAVTGAPGICIRANDSELESSTGPAPFAVNNPQPSVQEPKVAQQTGLNTEMRGRLANTDSPGAHELELKSPTGLMPLTAKTWHQPASNSHPSVQELKSSTEPTPFTVKGGHGPIHGSQPSLQKIKSYTGPTPLPTKTWKQPDHNSQPSIQDLKAAEQTRHNAELRGRLATAERQIAQLKSDNEQAEHRYRSQHGQLQAAERDATEFRKAHPSVAHYTRAKNEALQKLRIANQRLKEANDKIAEMERMLGAERYRTARLEASLATDGVGGRGEKTTGAGGGLSRR